MFQECQLMERKHSCNAQVLNRHPCNQLRGFGPRLGGMNWHVDCGPRHTEKLCLLLMNGSELGITNHFSILPRNRLLAPMFRYASFEAKSKAASMKYCSTLIMQYFAARCIEHLN